MSGITIPPEFIELSKAGKVRFIKVKKGLKKPLGKWSTSANYAHDDPEFIRHLSRGNNYGYMVKGSLCVLDADSPEHLTDLITLLGDTLVVKSGRDGEGYHILFECDDIGQDKIYLKYWDTDKKPHDIGDIRPGNSPFYVVGPGSIHPSGKQYEIVNHSPVRRLDPDPLKELLKKYTEEPKRDNNPSNDTVKRAFAVLDGSKVFKRRKQHEPGRNVYLFKYGCSLRSKGLSDSTIGYELIQVNQNDCIPPLDDSEVRGIITSVCCFPPGHGPKAESLQNWKEKQEKKKKKPQIDDETGLLVRDDTPLSITQLNLSDIGNALRFQALYGDKFRFDFSKNTWYYWNGEIWLLDNNGCAKKAAQYTIAKMADEIKVLYKQGDEKHAELVFKHMKKSASERARNDMLKTAAPHMAVTPGIWNCKPELLNLQNGTLNLETFKLQGFNQEDYLTFKAGVRYNPDAKCPEWLEHLNLVFGGDTELISAFQLMAGYSLLSGNPQQVFFIPYGSGKNGKSVTINTLRMIMGDYGIHAAPQSLMLQKNLDKARSDLVRIQYKRLVTSSEGEQGAKLDIGWIKQISGGEPIVARALYQNEIEFRVEAVIWFATNHKPIINEYNEAIWRRIWLIPFNQVIPEEKRIVDYERKLIESEGSGILNWMIAGLQRYYEAGGLIKPKAITNATDEYKEDEDPLGDYLKENTVIKPGAKVIDRDLFMDYCVWCTNNGIKYHMSKNNFTRHLLDHQGITSGRTKSSRLYLGIRLKTDEDRKRESEEVTKDTLEGFV